MAAGGGGDAAGSAADAGDLWVGAIKQSNRQKQSKNQIPLIVPPYHTTPKKNQSNQNTDIGIPGNIEHCAARVPAPAPPLHVHPDE